MPRCARCGEDNPERGRFCLACGQPLTAPAADAPETRRTVTVVFLDVVGSTGLAERLDPESLRSVMRRYFETARTSLERHGGTVQKFIGDAVMAVFGVPQLHEDDALRAVRAATEVNAALGALNTELRATVGVELAIRTGVNTGEVVAGRPEPGHALVLGDAVNVASRLQREAGVGEILIGPETHRLVAATVVTEPVASIPLRGRHEAVDAFRVVSMDGGPRERPARLETPMVGRTKELEQLRASFAEVRESGSTRLVTIVGDPGVGKSRLVQEFVETVAGAATVLRGRCLPYGDGITFWPLLEVVQMASGILDDDAPAAARDKIRRAVADAGDAELIAQRLAGLLGFDPEVSTLETGFWGARRFLETLAWETPVVVVFDDLHAAESTFLDLVEGLVQQGEDAAVLIVTPSRPELFEARPGWGTDDGRSALLSLAPLTADESDTLLEQLAPGGALPPEARRRIAEAAEGNPLFVSEVFRTLIDDGLLRQEGGRWVAAGDLGSVTVPPTVQALLATRLDRLPRSERAVIERASVVGKQFDERTVWALTPPEERPRVGERLQALARRDLVRPEEEPSAEPGAWRFTHLLIRDAAYQGMLKETRAGLHEGFATWLATRVGVRAEEDEIVGYHLEQAHRYRAELGGAEEEVRDLAGMAAAALASAGNRAMARGDVPATVSLLDRAVAIEPTLSRRVALVPDLAEALGEAGRFARAIELLESALAETRAVGDRVAEAHLRIALVKTRILTDPQGMADQESQVSDEVIPVFEAAGDELGLARAWHLRARAYNLWGRMADRHDALTQALEHARLAGAPRDETQMVTEMVSAVFYGPTPAEEGLHWLDRALRTAGPSLKVEARVRNAMAGFLAMMGRFEEARAVMTRSTELFDQLGMTLMRASTSQDRAVVYVLSGDLEGAERELREAYQVLGRMGERSYLCSTACVLGQVLVALGRMEEAEEMSVVGEEFADEDDLDAQILWRCVRARVMAARGEHEPAETLAREAVEFSLRTDFPQNQGDAYADLAEVLGAAGKDREAAEAGIEAARIYRSKGNVVRADYLTTRWGG
jgi:class 3 adenylate cyclase/tetratricopeptide (TPR) repeat protein